MKSITIHSEEELIAISQQWKQVILYGEKSLAVIMLRYYLQHGLDSRIIGVSYTKTAKESTTLLNKTLKPISTYLPDKSTCIFILGRDSEQINFLLSNGSDWPETQIILIDYTLPASLSQRENVPLDFLCVGFTKCGTTSLHIALNKNKQIYLPKRKEILYGRWKNRYLNAPERFHKIYFHGDSIPNGCKLGSIEPTFFFQSNFVYETYGDKAKILFLVRNPVSATYSYFIMMMKRSMDARLRTYYKKYKKFSMEMFHDYLHDYIYSGKDQRFSYAKWIKEYLRFYDPASIKIVFMEELIQKPNHVMKEIQEFIGVDIRSYNKLPHSNTGNRVSRNYLSARINGKLQALRVNLKSAPPRIQKIVTKLFLFIWKFTLVETHDKMLEADQQELKAFYHDSVRELEAITGRNLKEIWF